MEPNDLLHSSFSLSDIFKTCYNSGTRDADRHTEANPQRQGREHQEAAGDAADQGRGQGGGGQGPPADADGGTKTGQGSDPSRFYKHTSQILYKFLLALKTIPHSFLLSLFFHASPNFKRSI